MANYQYFKLTCLTMLFLQACSQADPSLNSNKIRVQAVQDAALSYGAQSALAWQSKQINAQLSMKQKQLANIYDFKRIMLPHNVLPPVIRGASNALNLDDNRTLRSSEKTIEIIKPARFVTVPPSWRDYLVMNFKAPEKPVDSMLPSSSDERAIWDKYVAEGWRRGYKQANAILSDKLGQLTQDYTGMAYFKKLYILKMVTAPQVAAADLGITGNSQKLAIGDRIVRITSDAILLPNQSGNWQSGLTIKKKARKKRLDHDLK